MSDRELPIVRAVAGRLYREILYELQTGGGVSFDAPPLDDGQREALAAIHRTIGELRELFKGAPRRLARHLRVSDGRVLDVGAGRAPWTIGLARHAGLARVTAVDLPEEIPVLNAAIASAGLEDRFEVLGVDVFGGEWGARLDAGAYDVAVVANVCHLFEAGRNRELLRRVVPLLRPGGTLAIIDQVLEEEPDWPRWAALYALGVLHCAPGGHLFPVRVYREWLEERGLSEVMAWPLCPLPPLTLVTARRPGHTAA